jgi:hypothetical protein
MIVVSPKNYGAFALQERMWEDLEIDRQEDTAGKTDRCFAGR